MRECESRRSIPFQGQQEHHRLGLLHGRNQRARRLSASSHSPGTTQVRDAVAPGKTRPATAGAKGDPLLPHPASPARLTHASSPRVNKNDSVRPSRQMRRTSSVEVAYHCAQHVRDVFHQATPTHGRRLTKTPHEAPTNVSHPRHRSTRPDPTQMEGRPLGLLRHSRSQQHTPPKPSTNIIELGRHTARGYPNPTNYQPRTLHIARGLDASTHTQL